MEPKERILQVAKDLGLAMTAEFVPWSQSRNRGDKQPSLNWSITLLRGHGKIEGGRAILTTDYSAGSGHAPSYKQGDRSVVRAETVAWECEHGKPGHWSDGFNRVMPRAGGKPVMPDFANILYSLVSDASVLDCSSFEEWASDLGYDADSRRAEGIYRACLDIALKLRNGIGEEGLQRLREATQDY